MKYRLRKKKFAVLNVDAGCTQTWIAEVTGWQREYVNKAIRHGLEVPEEIAREWSALMKVPLEDLFEEVEEPAEVAPGAVSVHSGGETDKAGG